MDITQASKKEALRRKCDVLWFWSLKSLARPKLLPRLGKPHIASPCASDVVEAPCIAFALRSLFQEGRLLGSLRHPFVVRYRDSFCEAGVLCIIMDFCEGGELARQIRRARRNHQRPYCSWGIHGPCRKFFRASGFARFAPNRVGLTSVDIWQ
ncbi:NEK1 [Symbiodinium necroappetens]|uniref:non-specific serine/threonine protein kinase n=1 Tax=Symbiodinium necroappetens TaxID=1628268 RepID=A0A813CBW3_9DINO|nr:NEK1 [Symbiodinium necroappetens]